MIHLRFPPRIIGIGPMKIIPPLLCLTSSGLAFKVNRTIKMPITDIKIPVKISVIDRSMLIFSPMEHICSLNLSNFQTFQRAALPMYSFTSHSLISALSTSTTYIACTRAFLISSNETGGFV